jgi:hypothetical protein
MFKTVDQFPAMKGLGSGAIALGVFVFLAGVSRGLQLMGY